MSEHKSGENRCSKGGYILKNSAGSYRDHDPVLIASGSEVEIALEAQEKLKAKNIDTRVVSVPCLDIFKNQPQSYQDEVLGSSTIKISIEASSQSGWKSTVGHNGTTLGLTTFGKSAPYKDIYKLFNLTSDEIVKIVERGGK